MNKRVFLVGAMKAATTTLYDHLTAHPMVYRAEIKEPQYIAWSTLSQSDVRQWPDPLRFRASARSVMPVRDRARYEALYAACDDEQWLVDASVFNLPHPPAAARIKEMFPDAKIIVVLRSMIDRAFSSYSFQRSKGAEWARTFDIAIEEELNGQREGYIYPWRNILCSRYGEQIERYYRTFADADILPIAFGQFLENPVGVMATVFSFLQIPPAMVDADRISNETFGPPKGFLAARISELIYTSNAPKAVVRSLLPTRYRKQVSQSIKASIPREAVMEMPSLATLERLGNIFVRDQEQVRRLTGLDIPVSERWRPQTQSSRVTRRMARG